MSIAKGKRASGEGTIRRLAEALRVEPRELIKEQAIGEKQAQR